LQNLEGNEKFNTTWNSIRENIKISAKQSIDYCKSKHHKKLFDEECSKLSDRRKQAKLQWLQNPSEMNEGNLINVSWEVIRHFRNKKRECSKEKIDELESNSKNKNIRDL
jgi:hypothetical protein